MLIISLLIFSICIGTIVLLIHDHDEIHRLVAWLSGLITIFCIFVLTPPLIKGLLGLLFLAIGHKIFPISNSFR